MAHVNPVNTPVFDGMNVRVFVPELAKTLGLNPAIVLCQMHYLLQNSTLGKIQEDGRRWIYNTYKDWQKDLCWLAPWEIGKHIRNLEAKGLLDADDGKMNDTPYHRRKWYTLNYEAIARLTGWNPLDITIVQDSTMENSQQENPTSSTKHSSIYKETPKLLPTATDNAAVAFSFSANTGSQPEVTPLPPSQKEPTASENDSIYHEVEDKLLTEGVPRPCEQKEGEIAKTLTSVEFNPDDGHASKSKIEIAKTLSGSGLEGGEQLSEEKSQVFNREQEQELKSLGVDISAAALAVRKSKADVETAIAYLKWAFQAWRKGVESPIAVFISACQNGKVPPTAISAIVPQASAIDMDWTQHPDWDKWLAAMRLGVPRFRAFAADFGLTREQATAIAAWAEEKNLILGGGNA